MAGFNWLHLTDLHWGLLGQRPLWPSVREAFFEDLGAQQDKFGEWHAVLFTGDFVQRGSRQEFAELEEQVLGPLWERLRQLGSAPVLLAVPGNHDLERPDGNSFRAAVTLLTTPGMFSNTVAKEFWIDPTSEYRLVINQAFTNYKTWWSKRPFCGGHDIADGLLPGDFSTSFITECGLRVGVVGLNTTFLQLTEGDYRGRLAWHVSQLNEVCNGDSAKRLSDNYSPCFLGFFDC